MHWFPSVTIFCVLTNTYLWYFQKGKNDVSKMAVDKHYGCLHWIVWIHHDYKELCDHRWQQGKILVCLFRYFSLHFFCVHISVSICMAFCIQYSICKIDNTLAIADTLICNWCWNVQDVRINDILFSLKVFFNQNSSHSINIKIRCIN